MAKQTGPCSAHVRVNGLEYEMAVRRVVKKEERGLVSCVFRMTASCEDKPP